jgi:hypothetical protein
MTVVIWILLAISSLGFLVAANARRLTAMIKNKKADRSPP